jgi:hypothetical protein
LEGVNVSLVNLWRALRSALLNVDAAVLLAEGVDVQQIPGGPLRAKMLEMQERGEPIPETVRQLWREGHMCELRFLRLVAIELGVGLDALAALSDKQLVAKLQAVQPDCGHAVWQALQKSYPAFSAEMSKFLPPPKDVSEGTDSQQSAPAPPVPRDWLVGWRTILDALELSSLWVKTTYEERRRRLKWLTERYGGPIIIGPRGRQPKVSRRELLEWWNGLAQKVSDAETKQRDAAATVAAQYLHGRTGVVCPDISGSVKR